MALAPALLSPPTTTLPPTFVFLLRVRPTLSTRWLVEDPGMTLHFRLVPTHVDGLSFLRIPSWSLCALVPPHRTSLFCAKPGTAAALWERDKGQQPESPLTREPFPALRPASVSTSKGSGL